MKSIFKIWVLCLITYFSTATFATIRISLAPGVGIAYVFPVNEAVIITNNFLWSVKAFCTAMSENESNRMLMRVLKKSGTFNNTKLSTSDSCEVTLYNKDNFEITAVPGAEFELTNIGDKTMFTHCIVI